MQKKRMIIRNAARQGEKGFTLIETAIASTIMLVGMLSIMQLFVLAALYNKSAKQQTMASTIAKKKMEQLLALPLPDATEPPPLGYGGALGSANAVTGYSENYYVDYDHNGVKGTMGVQNTPWYTNQAVSYVVTWRVQTDNVTIVDPDTGNNVPAYGGLRRITVMAEATTAALIGNGVQGGRNVQTERATLSTIRSASQ